MTNLLFQLQHGMDSKINSHLRAVNSASYQDFLISPLSVYSIVGFLSIGFFLINIGMQNV